MTKVKLKQGALNYFRHLSRNTNLEIEAYLIGTVVSPNLTIVDQFCYPKEYECQAHDAVQWSNKDYDRVFQLAAKKGKRVVGSIHSHPEWDAVLSPDDYKAHFTEGFRILGICSVKGRRTKVRFWVNDSALPCEIEFI